MNDEMISCPCCGARMEYQYDAGTCPSCGTAFAEDEMINIRDQERQGLAAMTDAVRGAHMLGRGGEIDWFHGKFKSQCVPNENGIAYYPVEAVRQYAEAEHIQIKPLPKHRWMWLGKKG